jgi:hypothetical protein
VRLDWSQLALLGLLAGPIHWLIGRAKITEWFWSRARRGTFAGDLLCCAACAGWWIGLALGASGVRPLTGVAELTSIAAGGVLGTLLAPVGEAVLLWGLGMTAMDDDEVLKD